MGILAERLELTDDGALQIVKRCCQQCEVKMRDVA
jgi:hypothetical protein